MKAIIEIKDFDYNAPVDGKNIINMTLNYNGVQRPIMKAFQIAKHIWVVPERYTFANSMSDLNPPSTARKNEVNPVYDKDYLTNNYDKDVFLKDTTMLFKRINSQESGQKLLSLISSAISCPELEGHTLKMSNFGSIQSVLEDGKIENKIANIIIYGPGPNLISKGTRSLGFEKISENKIENRAANCKGCMSEIYFSANYLKSQFKNNSGSFINQAFKTKFVPDPASPMIHELIHGIHNLYGISFPDTMNFDFKTNTIKTSATKETERMEEILTFGGRDVAVVKEKINSNRKQAILSNYKIIYEDIISSSNEAGESGELKSYMEQKIKTFSEDTSGQKIIDNSEFLKHIETLWFGLNETGFAEDYKIKIREQYMANTHEPIFVKISQSENYSIDEGFNINNKGFGDFKGQNFNNDYFIKDLKNLVRNPKLRICNTSSKFNKYGLTEICTLVDKSDLFFISDKESFENMDFSEEKINYNTVLTERDRKYFKDRFLTNYDFSYTDSLPPININEIIKFETPNDNSVLAEVEQDRELTVDKLTTFHYLEAQKMDSTFDPLKEPLEMVTSAEEALLNSKKVYTPFPDTAKRIREAGNSIANDYFFYQWLKNVVSDFTDESTQKSTVDKVANVSWIVPYVGPALNIGLDLYRGDFVKAFEDGGTYILLEYVPEVGIPLLIGLEIIGGELEKEEVAQTVNNALAKRNEKWHEVYGFAKAQWWGMVHTQFEKRIHQVYESLSHQVIAIKANMDYQLANYKGSSIDKTLLREQIDEAEVALNRAVHLAMKNVEEFIVKSSKSYLINEMIPNVREKLKAFDATTKVNLDKFIDDNSSILGTTLVRELKEKVNSYLNPTTEVSFDISSIPDFDLDSQIDRFDLQLKDDLVFSLGGQEGKIKDLSGNDIKLTISSDTKIVQGRDNNAIRLNSNESSKIIAEKNENIHFSYFSDFTISFWIRIPRYNKNDLSDLGNEYTIINNINNQGWKISIKDGNLLWIMKDNDENQVVLSTSLFNFYVSGNIWKHIIITNSPLSDSTIYMDGKKIESKSIKELRNIDNDSPIIFKLDGNKNKNQFIRLDQFNIYQKALNENEVEMLFDSYFNSNILRDFWGEPLEYNKTYYMKNQTILGGPLKTKYLTWYRYDYPYLDKSNTFNVGSYFLIPYLYNEGSSVKKIIIINKQKIDKYIRKNDTVELKIESTDNCILTLPNYNKSEDIYMIFSDTDINGALKLTQLQSKDKNYCQVKIFENPRLENPRNGLLSITEDKNWLCYSKWYLDNYKTLDGTHTKTNWYFVSKDEGWKE